MEVEIQGNTVTVTGQPMSHRHYDLFKEAVSSVIKYGEEPHIVFENAATLGSSFIGFMVSLQGRKIPYTVEIHNQKLLNLLEDLHLMALVRNP